MAGNNVEIVSSYMKYNTKEVEQLLDQVAGTTTATAEGVRSIVKNYLQDSEQEQEPSEG